MKMTTEAKAPIYSTMMVNFDVEKVIDHVASGFSSLMDHPTLSKLVLIDIDHLGEDGDLFISGLEAKLGGKISMSSVASLNWMYIDYNDDSDDISSNDGSGSSDGDDEIDDAGDGGGGMVE